MSYSRFSNSTTPRIDTLRNEIAAARDMLDTGLLDQDPARPRSPEVQAVIDRDERERQ